MILIAILIRIDSPGPVIFRQKRVGFKGRPFTLYKFRTMVEGAESMGPVITEPQDARITQIGNLLRWLKLDELPQFFNIVKGDMSLVGPRPEVPQIVEKYNQEEKGVLEVLPGILGPSQIKNRDEAAMMEGTQEQNIEKFYEEKILPEKLRRDLEYVRSKNPLKDFKLLFGGTARVLFSSIKLSYIFESRRRILFLLFDLYISILSFWLAFELRFEGAVPPAQHLSLLSMLPLVVIVRMPCFIYFGLYQSLWQYLGIQELLAIIKAVFVGSLLLPVVPYVMHIDFEPRSILIIDGFLLTMALGGVRIIFKLTAERLRRPVLKQNRKNVLIIGAEDNGELLVREFIKQPQLGYRPVGFLDNDFLKFGVRIHGVKVMGSIAQLPQVAKVKKVDEVIIALPQASGNEIKAIMQNCRRLHLSCRIIPAASSLLSPQILPLKLRPVDVSDLLGRSIVQADITGIENFFRGKKILITGAGGSIGSELARIIFQNHPREIILVENSENNLFEIQTDLRSRVSETEITGYLRDVTHKSEMEKIFQLHKPEIIYHAAAHKHVSLVETHCAKGIINNVLGTKIMADLALQYQAERFVLISTDKAIRPKSIMGTTKRIAELYCQSLKGGKTHFLAVRFGNVFNSTGSVVPLFKKQIEAGGPITVTDPEVTRYFMDVSEAVFLILQTTVLGSESEIFILEMGKPVKILELAQNLIQMMGLSTQEIPIRFTGLKQGEKLHEEVEADFEKAVPTAHKKIKIWKSLKLPQNTLAKEIEALILLAQQGATREEMITQLCQIVPEYQPDRRE